MTKLKGEEVLYFRVLSASLSQRWQCNSLWTTNLKGFGRKQSHVIKMLAWYLAKGIEEYDEKPHPWQSVSRPRFEPGTFPAQIVVTATLACLMTVCCLGWWEQKGECWVEEDETRSQFWALAISSGGRLVMQS